MPSTTQNHSLADILNEIESRAKAATKGPWKQDDEEPRVITFNDPEYSKPMSIFGLNTEGMAIAFEKPDADFIASARTDLPKLVKALRRAAEFIKYAQRVFPKHYQHWDTACLEELAAILTSPENGEQQSQSLGEH